MKKVLIINTTMDKGGAARIARELFDHSNQTAEIHFAYGRKSASAPARSHYFGNKIEPIIHGLLVRFLGLEGSGSLFSTRKLIRYIQKENFDLVNIHNLHGYYVNFPALLRFLKKTGVPVLYSLHDEWPITWLPAHSMGCTHCKTGKGVCTNTYTYPKSFTKLFARFMIKRKHKALTGMPNMTLVSPSGWLTDSIKNSFMGTYPIETVHHGIDTELFAPARDVHELRAKHDLPADKKIVLCTASNLTDTSKGVRDIVEIAEMLSHKDYLFVVLGKGSITGHANIYTPGYIYDKHTVAEFYALSDVFCFATGAETFLLSAAEAMSCGVPAVGYDLPVVRELVTDTVGALAEHDSSALAKAIDDILTDSARRAALGQSAREHIISQYSRNDFFSKYMALYDDHSRQS